MLKDVQHMLMDVQHMLRDVQHMCKDVQHMCITVRIRLSQPPAGDWLTGAWAELGKNQDIIITVKHFYNGFSSISSVPYMIGG